MKLFVAYKLFFFFKTRSSRLDAVALRGRMIGDLLSLPSPFVTSERKSFRDTSNRPGNFFVFILHIVFLVSKLYENFKV